MASLRLCGQKLSVAVWQSKRVALSTFVVSIMCFASRTAAQESASVFSFLNLPTSAHAVALGGQGSAIIDEDASLVISNPALMMSMEERTANFNFLTFMQGMKVASANYVQPSGDTGAWGATAQFLSYGGTQETDVEGNIIGNFTPIDLLVGGGYSRVLSEYWVAGAMGKLFYSHYGSLSSVALGVDVGLNYYNEDSDLSLSLTARNIGVQLKAFGDKRERLPFNVELGFRKALDNTPFTFYVTMTDLNHWNSDYYWGEDGEISFGKLFINHFVVGVDARVGRVLRLSMGYNFRRAYELKAANGAHGAGLSLGAGIDVKRFSLGVSWAKYHVSTSSLAFSAQYRL